MWEFLTDPTFWPYFITVLFAAIGGGIFGNYNQYKDGKKSMLQPPGFVFGIVWPILYLLIIAAGYLADLNAPNEVKSLIRFVFLMQILFNFLYSYLGSEATRTHLRCVGGTRDPLMALIIIIILDILVIFLIYQYFNIYPIAGYLLLPYLIWLILATYLTFYNYKKSEKCPNTFESQT